MDFFICCDRILGIMKKYDVIILGAGAAGLSAAAQATQRGLRVAVLDMGHTPARKVLASGGGKCNITNTAATRDKYFGQNPDFVRGALSRVSPTDILNWAHGHNIKLYEKSQGRFFCVDGAEAVVRALMHDAAGADIFCETQVTGISKSGDMFYVNDMCAKSVIVATGGISFGVYGVSDVGYKIAKKFGHRIISPRPALCALAIKNWPGDLAGISIPVEIMVGGLKIKDSMLFTHFGIGGPATYRASLGDTAQGMQINLMPECDVWQILRDVKRTNGRRTVVGILSEYLPARIAKWIVGDDTRRIADIKDTELKTFAECTNAVNIPGADIKYHNMASAEITFGGVDTRDISSKTMESKLCPGLFFAGEVIDVAGDLGGFNLQWAWASGRVAGQNV